MRGPEHYIQKAYFQWAKLHPEARCAFAIPNGGGRSKAQAGVLKAEGVRPGVLDTMLPKVRGGAAGLWIEFKSKDGRVTKEQKEELARLAADGYAVAVCRDAAVAVSLTQDYLAGRIGPGLVSLDS